MNRGQSKDQKAQNSGSGDEAEKTLFGDRQLEFERAQ